MPRIQQDCSQERVKIVYYYLEKVCYKVTLLMKNIYIVRETESSIRAPPTLLQKPLTVLSGASCALLRDEGRKSLTGERAAAAAAVVAVARVKCLSA